MSRVSGTVTGTAFSINVVAMSVNGKTYFFCKIGSLIYIEYVNVFNSGGRDWKISVVRYYCTPCQSRTILVLAIEL